MLTFGEEFPDVVKAGDEAPLRLVETMNQYRRNDPSPSRDEPRRGEPDRAPELSAVSAHAHEVQRIVQLVTDGSSVEVLGGRWSGRTQVLGYVRAALSELGFDVLAVSGMGALLPLEAVASALPPVYRDMTSGDDRSTVAIRDALVEFLAESRSVVVVDDSDLLDETSWGVLVSASNLVGSAVVSTRLRRAGASDNVLATVARSVIQVSLKELRLETLHAVLEERVDGTLSPAVTARIHAESAGIPGLAVVLLDGALAQGQVRRRGDQWMLGPTVWSDDASDAYESLLHSYTPQVRDAVELLAVAGTMDLDAAWVLLGEALVEELEDHQLVRLTSVGSDHRPVVGVHPPGIGDYYLHQPVSARRRRIVTTAVARLDAADQRLARTERDRLLARLGSPRPIVHVAEDVRQRGAVRSADVPVVVRMFTESYTHELTSARTRWETSRDYASAVRYLHLQLSGQNDPEEFERVFVGVVRSPETDPVDEVRLRHVHSRWLLTLGATVDEAVRPLVDDVPDGFEHAEALDTLTHLLRWENEGLDASFAELLEPRAGRPGFDGQVASVVLAACFTMAARPHDAVRVLDATEPGLRRGEEIGAGVLRGLALYATGRFAEAFELATEQMQQAISTLDRVAFAGYSYLGALAQIALGHLEEAQDTLAVVLGSGIVTEPMAFTPNKAIPVAMAVISTRTGHEAAASGFADHASQVLGTSDALPFASAAWAEAISVAGSGETEVAAGIFAELIGDARARGYVLSADVAQMASLMIHFDPAGAERFRDRAEELGGSLFTAYLDARAAAHDRDPGRVEAAARLLHEHDSGNEALTFFMLASRLYREGGDLDGAARARASARTVGDRLGISARSMAALEEPDFTAREREVIRLVAAGRSNNEIASELFVGVRTVESHMRNIRRKSGAVGRKEIAGFA